MSDDCIFCKIVKKEISSDFIYENDNFFPFMI
ncbi:MAG: HIT family protein [Candidatus Nanoarchaeia archaeon]